MPAYIHHHDAEPPFMICPSCVGLPMYAKDVAPQWSMAKIDYIYECFDCGAEIRADGDQAGTVPREGRFPQPVAEAGRSGGG